MSEVKLSKTEKAALDLIIAKLEEDGVAMSDPQAVVITAATPAVVEATVMVAVTVAGSCLVADDESDLVDFRQAAERIKDGVSLEQLQNLRSKVVD